MKTIKQIKHKIKNMQKNVSCCNPEIHRGCPKYLKPLRYLRPLLHTNSEKEVTSKGQKGSH